MNNRILFKEPERLIYIYNAQRTPDKKYLALLKSKDPKLKAIDVNLVKIKNREWLILANYLQVEVESLIDKKHPDFIQVYGKDEPELSPENALKILSMNSKTLIHPIVLKDKKAILLKTMQDINRLF